MFWKRKTYPEYEVMPAFVDPVGQASRVNRSLPLTSYRGGTGIPVLGSLNALNPANIKPTNAQVIVSPYGQGTQPNYPPILQPLTRSRDENVGNL